MVLKFSECAGGKVKFQRDEEIQPDFHIHVKGKYKECKSYRILEKRSGSVVEPNPIKISIEITST